MRLPDWHQRLAATIEAATLRPFVYGEHDCCTFAADCVLAVTGRDLASPWRGAYATPAAGLKLARARNVAGLARRFFREIDPAFAWTGDVALTDTGGLAIVDGKYLVAPMEGGLGRGVGRGARAWRVA